jgi:CBS domain containing-hemolysin-like protein
MKLFKVWLLECLFVHSSSLVVAVHSIFKGLSSWLVGFTDRIEKTLGSGKTNTYSLEQLDQAIELTTPQDATEEEKNILKGIIKFGNITVRQVMRSRLDVHGIDADASFEELIKTVQEMHYSRFPVFKGNLDNVTGIIHTKDLIPHLQEPPDFDWKGLKTCCRNFQLVDPFAVVVDEFGGTEIVTLEDVLESRGDIRDEFDEDEGSDSN